jgi:hypothetical protein
MAGAAVAVFDRVSMRLPERASPYLHSATFIACAVLLVRLTTEIVRGGRKLDLVMQKKGSCDDALDFIRNAVPRTEPILSSSPWYLTWLTDRPSVAAPSNGGSAFATVTAHYDVRWAVTGLPTFAGAAVGLDIRRLEESGEKPHPRLAFDGPVCDVYRLER